MTSDSETVRPIEDSTPSRHLGIPEVVVVVPTFHEASNLPELVHRIAASMQAADLSIEIVVVDDNSQDGTDRVCKELSDRYPLRLMTRIHERGLASAVLYGIRHSVSRYVAVMDADLSHPPEDLSRLIRRVKAGADFVVGSRYVSGGSTDAQWSIWRWVNSKVATLLAIGLTNVKDPMSGFFAFPRHILERAPSLLPVGYKIGLEILVKTGCRNVAEIPIAFKERTRGESKLTLHQQVLYLRHLRRLYQYCFPRATELAHFLLVGGSGVLVDLSCYLSLTYLAAVDHQVGRAISFISAASWNWFLNRWFTFLAGRERPAGRQWLEFLIAASLGFAANWGTYKLLTDHVAFFMSNHLAGFFAGIPVGVAFNYASSRMFVFRPFDAPIAGKEPSAPPTVSRGSRKR